MEWSLAIDKAMPRPLRGMLRGVGQVFFCCNAVTGDIILLALWIGGVTEGAAAAVGGISSTAAANVRAVSEVARYAGVKGGNGTLGGTSQ